MSEEKKKELDPLYVDKKQPTMEEMEADGGLVVGAAEDSKINSLDSITYEDHQQVFGAKVVTDEQPADASIADDDSAGPADNLTDEEADQVEQ